MHGLSSGILELLPKIAHLSALKAQMATLNLWEMGIGAEKKEGKDWFIPHISV